MDEQVRDIVIVGAGGLGRKVKWLIDRINVKRATWNVVGFYDDAVVSTPSGYPPILGGVASLMRINKSLGVVLALGNSEVRRTVYDQIRLNTQLYYPTLIDPESIVADSVVVGKGMISFALSVITTDIMLGDFVHVSQCCSIGHDVSVGDFCTLYPNSIISGNVVIGSDCEFGANSCILQGLDIAKRVSIGAGAVVTRNIEEEGATYVGVPARRIK